MDFKKVEYSIIKYLTNEADMADLDFLSEWISDPKNDTLFESYVKTHYEVRLLMNSPNVDHIKKNLLEKIKKDKSPFYRYKIPSVLKYAAIIVVILSIGYLYKETDQKQNPIPDVTYENVLTPKEETITIQLDDGTIRPINPKDQTQIVDANGNIIGKQKQSQLNYKGTAHQNTLMYNTLNVPRGKRFDLILSDGTHVYLNAGTSLRYPVKFIPGVDRDVFLKGEAYFDVTENKKHPFIVHVDDMNIKVLGTQFNVSYYANAEKKHTVLVEGVVALSGDHHKKSIALKPGYKAEWNTTQPKIAIENVDTRIYTAWIDGKLIFRNATFKYIRHTLERRYNVTIKNSNEDLDKQLFDATFDIESIHDILETFNRSYAIEYKITNNEVLIY